MKRLTQKLTTAAIVALALVAHTSSARAAVFVDDAKIGTGGNGPPALYLTKSMSNGLFLVQLQTFDSITYRFDTDATAEAFRMFAAQPGDLVDIAFVQNSLPLVTNQSDLSVSDAPQVFQPNETKYYAYWDDRSMFDPGAPYEDRRAVSPTDSFGWLALTRVGTTLQITSSVSVTSVGAPIRVGSFVAEVPEPATWAMASLGLSGLMATRLRLRRRSS